jgi:hypothetical protein
VHLVVQHDGDAPADVRAGHALEVRPPRRSSWNVTTVWLNCGSRPAVRVLEPLARQERGPLTK